MTGTTRRQVVGFHTSSAHSETHRRVDARAQGQRHGRKRIARLMRLEGLRAKRSRRYRTTTQSDARQAAAPNLLGRRFAVRDLNRVWTGDVTACWTAEGWLYLAALLDLGSRRVVGWAASATLDQALTLTALRRALAQRQPAAGLVHHSDRGTSYTGADYQAGLGAAGLTVSMSRRSDCWDNAVLESFFATLKTELVHDARWGTRATAIAALGAYIEGWYNRRRRHSTLNYLSPAEFERGLRAA